MQQRNGRPSSSRSTIKAVRRNEKKKIKKLKTYEAALIPHHVLKKLYISRGLSDEVNRGYH